MKSILMTLYGPLETDARVLRSIEAAVKADCKVIIITCNTHDNLQMHKDVVVINLPFKALGAKSYVRFCWHCFKYIIFNKNRYEILYLHDYYSVVVGRLCLPFVKKKKIIYDAHELILPYPKEKISLKKRVFLNCEKAIASKVDLIIEANKERELIIRDAYSLSNTMNILNITNYKVCENKRKLDAEPFLVYQGALTESRKISFFIEAMKFIPKAKLMLIGDGVSAGLYKNMVKEYELDDRVILTGRLSNLDMMERMKRASIGIISYPFNSWNNIYCSPNKVFEYAAISLPFISTAQPFLKEIENKYRIGVTFDFGDIESFVHQVNYLLNHYEEYTRNFNLFLSDYSYEQEMYKLVKVLKGL